MANSKKIILPIVALVAAAIGVFFLAPLQAWKKKTGIRAIPDKITNMETLLIVTNKTHVFTPDNTPYYAYCVWWWKAYFGTQMEYTDENHTYEGGELPEVTVTP